MMPRDNFYIEKMNANDLDEVVAVSNEAFGEMAWSYNSFLSAIKNHPSLMYVARTMDKKLVGFLAASSVLDEISLDDIAVKNEFRGKKIGELLVAELLENTKSHFSSIFLEVRSKNFVAISLYRKLGFIEVGVRKNYYKSPPDDAILMTRNFKDVK